MRGPVRAVRANTCALLASNDVRSDPLQATCARPGPPAHPRATIMRWASDNGEQHDQCASLARTPSCLPESPHLARDLDHPRTYAPPLCAAPVRTESCTTSPQASRAPSHACSDSPHWQTHARYLPATTRARIHFKHLARDLDHLRTHASPLCVGPLTTESSTTSAQASRAPHRAGLTPRTLRATWTTRTPTRHHYALRQ